MIAIIIFLCLHVLGCFAIQCANNSYVSIPGIDIDDVNRWGRPSVLDLDTTNIYVIDKYVKQIVCPYHDFVYLYRILCTLSETAIVAWGLFLLTWYGIIVSVISYVNKMYLCELSSVKAGTALVIAAISLVVCVALFFVVHVIYKKKLYCEDFNLSRQQMEENYTNNHEHNQTRMEYYTIAEFPIRNPETCGYILFSILVYTHFLRRIEDKIKRRQLVEKLAVVAFVVLMGVLAVYSPIVFEKL